MGERHPMIRGRVLAGQALVMAGAALVLYVAFSLSVNGQPALALPLYGIAVAFALLFTSRRFYAQRFLFPALAGVALFTLLPVGYTVWLGFTNFSSFNLLSFERVREIHLGETVADPASERKFALVAQGNAYRVVLEGETDTLVSEPVSLDGTPREVRAYAAPAPSDPLPLKAVVPLREALSAVTVKAPDGTLLRLSGLRTFSGLRPAWQPGPDGTLRNTTDGSVLTPDWSRGFYITAAGETVAPGWRVMVGWDNFARVLGNPGIREPMVAIFGWTVLFAFGSVAATFVLGLLLASVLQWPHLKGKALYRLLLILPYAVPGFISILVFKGLFNQNFGEINVILKAVFGVAPNWSTDPNLARTMILIVNTWLGYPYMMLLAMGFLQSVPEDQKQSAAIDGAGPVRSFLSITLPQILPPFVPLLISSFAFNFNNLVLIVLLTGGGPDRPGTLVPAGETDILGSFTYRIGFRDSGQQFGLAGAITLLIFVLVTVIAYANLVMMRRAERRSA